jgi:hypothetical protein
MGSVAVEQGSSARGLRGRRENLLPPRIARIALALEEEKAERRGCRGRGAAGEVAEQRVEERSAGGGIIDDGQGRDVPGPVSKTRMRAEAPEVVVACAAARHESRVPAPDRRLAAEFESEAGLALTGLARDDTDRDGIVRLEPQVEVLE